MGTWQPTEQQAADLAEKLVRYFNTPSREDPESAASLGLRRSRELLSLLQSTTTQTRELEIFARTLESEAAHEGSAFNELAVWARRIAEIRGGKRDPA